jgi:hypothetical protein
MEWPIIVALVAVVPLILIPVALIWYIQVGGLYTVLRERRKRAAKSREQNEANERLKALVLSVIERL